MEPVVSSRTFSHKRRRERNGKFQLTFIVPIGETFQMQTSLRSSEGFSGEFQG